ncbi:uncharacterized protein LAESUDRAFT_5761 [Laetiporus sulphureus 93-53]|uniref:C2H2-type domain-containing protein n=1 Tax=Laetiporus sulphureus 93-53 TaxID=1314785 RepID=A0A165I457_9APHY|nr:uncharacterized protein LAESUDRAFT_5761 [Laetiporus sulphureus 93-53]KZT12571.1 hypothetical protein LAESUDRAFT_5761 [Laetiporus sulphureus 93-53]
MTPSTPCSAPFVGRHSLSYTTVPHASCTYTRSRETSSRSASSDNWKSSLVLPPIVSSTPDESSTARRPEEYARAVRATRGPSTRSVGGTVAPLRPQIPSRTMSDPHLAARPPASETQRPLSVYESPTATYMWPRFDPSSQGVSTTRPLIYVKYKPGPTSSDEREEGPSGYRGRSASSVSEGSTSNPRKRGSSAETGSESTPPSPSDRFLKHRRLAPPEQPSHVVETTVKATTRDHVADTTVRSTGLSPAVFTNQRGQRSETDLDKSFHRLDIETDESEEESDELTDQGQASSTDQGDHASDVLRGSNRTMTRNATQDRRIREEWLRYAVPAKPSKEGAQYTCLWMVNNDFGLPCPCEYTSKRHLVKRHIESLHLLYRPCKCTICGKGFAQKSNLETHMNTHTGATPHKCPYPNCNEAFKDPARRHRHMKAVHQHVSSRRKKQPAKGGSAPS